MKTRPLPMFFVLAFAAIITANAQTETQNKITYHDPGLKKVVQVAIVVRDIEATARLWAELLDVPMPPISTTRPGNEVKEIYRGKPTEGQTKLTFFNLGQVVIELMQPINEGTSWKEFLDTKGKEYNTWDFRWLIRLRHPKRLKKQVTRSYTGDDTIRITAPIFIMTPRML